MLASAAAQSVIPKNIPAATTPTENLSAGLAGAATIVQKNKAGSPAGNGAETAPASPGSTPSVLDVKIVANNERATFDLLFDRAVDVEAFALADPYRVVIDLPETEFRLSDEMGRISRGLIAGFRYGLFAPGSSRIVIDTLGPVRISRKTVTARFNGAATHFELEAVSPDVFAAIAAAAPPKPHLRPGLPASEPAAQAPGPPSDAFVIVIDPGHGGVDGGAVGAKVLEKDVVLAVAQKLKAVLETNPRYDVRATRMSDVFVGLDQRVAMSEAANAHLFISLHADSVGDAALARSVRGATVYTLSDKASNVAAQSLADKENSADASGGLFVTAADERLQVNTILTDLMKRETHGFSQEFQHMLIQRMHPGNLLARDPARSAGFRVLRQLQTPTVLIELGFISHQTDAEQMQATEWQQRIAVTIAAAVDAYASKRGLPSKRASVP